MAVVIITIVVTMVISITVTSVVVIVIIKKCKETHDQQTQQAPRIQPTMINNSITADTDIESNTTEVKMQSNPSYDIMNMENNSVNVKLQNNPAYYIMQEDSHRDEDDYYY